MDYQILSLKKDDNIGIITISRPQALNALNSSFFIEMDSMLEDVEKDADIKVAIITGEGKAFAAGADIAEMSGMKKAEAYEFSRKGQDTFNSIENLSKPVIAAVNGFALGGGCELTMACDFRIASSKAKFGQPEVNLGLIPGYAGTQRLSRLVGLADALFLLFTADMIKADEALRIQLVQKVVEPEQLMEETIKIAKSIAAKGPMAVKKIKEVVRKGFVSDFKSGSNLESEHFSSLFENEGAEGMKAFLEKRGPNWE
ncbi:MAG: enoyl-CoA hydratase/isomerase family protein [Calditrichia bacterium]|nr:enoyl-CoA hydratase/isomerase family protein [Calditrichia bacterium]